MSRRSGMGLEKFLRYTKVLGSSPKEAQTTDEIRARWRAMFDQVPSLRSVQGDMEYLTLPQGRRGALVRRVNARQSATGRGAKAQQPRFYLARSQVMGLLLTEQDAQALTVARQVYGHVLTPAAGSPEQALAEGAERAMAESQIAARLRDGIRILPHGGVGRVPATFSAQARDAAMEALCQSRVLTFDYRVEHRNPKGRVEHRRASVLGLVAKDGQLYAVGVTGLVDAPKSYALHRMSNVLCSTTAAVQRPEFNLDAYIAKTHQFSFPLDAEAAPVELRLRVHKDAIYHFRERPLEGQRTPEPSDDPDWFRVSARLPVTTQLVPFLLSMGPWIEVLGPAQVRAETAVRARGMYSHYERDTKP